ncbi:MAG: adenylate/guanylate cyclase domain-containing protein [Rhizobiaceae bacterium]
MKKPTIDRMRTTGKGPIIQRIRLWSGLVLTAYVLCHYINHAAGHISLAAMEHTLEFNEAIWSNWLGLTLLYGAMQVHIALGLWKVATLRTWRLPAWEWFQILLGLTIPWMLYSHIVFTRGSESLIGIEVDYGHELALLWPDVWIRQSILLLIVWVHAFVGIHFWLRIRSWYPAWFPIFAGVGVLIPTLALTGWIVAARREFDRTAQTAASAGNSAGIGTQQAETNRQIIDALRQVEWFLQTGALVLVSGAALFFAARLIAQRFNRRVKITYGDGNVVTSTPGNTILDISRAWGIPHMSVCGGRARCSTCRTLVISGKENCTPPTEAESLLLKRLNADSSIRLACQCRVRGDVEVRPLIQSRTNVTSTRNVDPLGWGVEREVAIFFLDIRGFSRISEKSLPYDVVFILNSLFGEVGAAVESANGYIDKFMGDGMLAIFGLASTPEEASRDALRAALAALDATTQASRMLTHHISEPIRIGIGIHAGDAVVGRIGRTSDQTTPSRLTAVGGAVNIAARLETATKELASLIVVSAHTLDLAGIPVTESLGQRSELSVHNITEPVDVVAIAKLDELRRQLGADAKLSDIALSRPQGPAGKKPKRQPAFAGSTKNDG